MTRLSLRAALPFAFVAALACAGADAHEPSAQSKPSATNPSMTAHSAASMEFHRIMMQGGKMPMPMSGNVDKDFASMMTMHHQQAIKMVDVMLKSGGNAKLKALATKMKASQQAEIKIMAPYTK